MNRMATARPTEDALKIVQGLLRRLWLQPQDYYNIFASGHVRLNSPAKLRIIIREFLQDCGGEIPADWIATMALGCTDANRSIAGMILWACEIDAETVPSWCDGFMVDSARECELYAEHFIGDGIMLADRWYPVELEFID